MRFSIRTNLAFLLVIVDSPLCLPNSPSKADVSSKAIDFVEKKVRPILVKHCYTCHSAETKSAGDLRVDDRNSLLVGGKNGAAIGPVNPETSLLIQRITHKDAKRQMPRE